MATYLQDGSIAYQCIRELLLSTRGRECKVARELWSGPNGTYQAYRQFLRKSVRLYGFASEKSLGLHVAHHRSHSSQDFTPRSKPYTFSGMKHVFEASQLGITALAFGALSSQLLAFANVSGDVWVVALPPDAEPTVTQMQHVHKRAVQGLDWSFDSSLLLTTSLEGAACLWAPPATAPVRTLAVRGAATSCKFHPTNPNVIIIGTSKSAIEVFNASTGARTLKQAIPGGGEVTALAATPTHLFAADSTGSVHVMAGLLRHGLPQKPRLQHRLRVGASPLSSLALQRICPSADNCPVLLVACHDSTLAVLKVVDQGRDTVHLQVHWRHTGPRTAQRMAPVWCPQVALQDSEYIAMGGEGTAVGVFDIGRAQGAAPMPVAVLHGHGAPATCVSWSYDEALLASGDSNGMVAVWARDTPAGSSAGSLMGTPRSSASTLPPPYQGTTPRSLSRASCTSLPQY